MSDIDTITTREDRHRDGSLKARGHMLGGALHGFWERYRLDGTMMRSGSFDSGRQIGEWTTFARDGTVAKVRRFARGAAA